MAAGTKIPAVFQFVERACNVSGPAEYFNSKKRDNGGVYVFDDIDEAAGGVSRPGHDWGADTFGCADGG